MKRLLEYLSIVLGLVLMFNIKGNSNESLKSGFEINKKNKILYTDFSKDSAFWYFYPFKINDLRGDGTVYYKFEHDTGNKGKYYRTNKNRQ